MSYSAPNYADRLQRLQQKMHEQQIEACLITQNVDLFYFTGTMQSGYLFLPVEGDPILYVRRSFVRAQEESKVSVEPLGSFRSFGDRLREKFALHKPTIATEFDVLPVQMFRRLESILPDAQWVDGSQMIRETRMIKSSDEILRIQEAARVVDLALETVLAQLHEGMTELALMSEIELILRRNGHSGMMRMRGYNQDIVTGIVGAGAAVAQPTYFDGPAGGLGLSPAFPKGVSRRPIERNEPILLDLGCCIDGYVIDQTRTAVIGKLPEDLSHAYDVAEKVLRQTEARLQPGTICEDLYSEALEVVEQAGLSDHFMGFGADQVKFLGHGIGLEIDEFPILAKGFTYPLQPGMVIAIEPKFTFPGRGVVGIENTYVVTEDGCERLTISREEILTVPLFE